MRSESKAMKTIRRMCDDSSLSYNDVHRKAKLLLGIYRDVVWATEQDAFDYQDAISDLMGQNLTTALTYLNDFAPTENRDAFERRVTGLFETKWMIDLIDIAMAKIYLYHSNGKLYHEILSKCYLTSVTYNESELLEAVCLERSTFYERKKEAVSLLGVSLWGYAIPALQEGIQKQSA